jgi:hypothetical protein
MNRVICVPFLIAAVVPFASNCHAAAPCDYAVVVSKKTHDDPQWKKVVEALVKKHAAEYHAQVIEYADDVNESLAPLKKMFPRYAAFVAQPEGAGREFVIKIHRLTRKLDDDPYTDVRWGIVTAYDTGDALRIVNTSDPLEIDRGAAGTGMDLNLFDEGFVCHEGSDDEYTEKAKGGKPEKRHGEADAAKPLVELFDKFKPQLFLTSGHATWRDWQIGYPPHKRGQFRCKDGVLYGVDLEGNRYPLRSPTPKVYLPSGNCLMGLVRDKQSMALAWLGSGGADQMIGYVVSTWYGRGGWGTRDYFFSEPGRYTLSDAFYFNNQAITYQLQTRFPKTANTDCSQWNIESDPGVLNRLAEKLGYTHDEPGLKDNLGLHWDHDTVAFYGDPAWDARLKPQPAHFTQKLAVTHDVKGDRYTFTLQANEDCKPGTPPAVMLPHRVKDIAVVKGQELKPLVTSKFVMVMEPGKLEKGKSYEIVFTAKEVDRDADKTGKEEATAPSPADDAGPVLKLVPGKYRDAVAGQLAVAGKNRGQLIAALKAVPEQQRAGLAFLIANMPRRDLTSLSRDFLLTNLKFAYQARADVPWGADLPDEVFFNDVLPYASINERRDDWRKDFYDRFMPIAKKCKTAGEAAIALNKETFQQFDVHYNAQKRPKPDQSPYESVKAKYASCTGLSVLAVDAFRAVAIPARFAGVPEWTGSPGNHSWAEMWDGSWHILGAAESSHLDQAWFNGKAAQANPANRLNRIYATSYERTGTSFPLVWAPWNETVPAVDVTSLYKLRRTMNFRVVDAQGKPAKADVTLRLNGHIVASGSGKSSYEFTLSGGLTYDVQLLSTDHRRHLQKIELPKEGSGPFDLNL